MSSRSPLDVEDHVLEPDAAIPAEQFFASSQAKYFTDNQGNTTCAQKAHIGIVVDVPTSVPKRGPRAIIRHPPPTKFAKKMGLKSMISGPFCDSRQP
jgi:hypothetical protein